MNKIKENIKRKKLYKSQTDKKFLGVLGGLAKYLEIDSSIVRLVFIILAFILDGLILSYFIAALIIPEESI